MGIFPCFFRTQRGSLVQQDSQETLERQVSMGKTIRSAKGTDEKPLGRPQTYTADPGEGTNNLLIRSIPQTLKVQHSRAYFSRNVCHIFSFPGTELDCSQPRHPGGCDGLGTRESIVGDSRDLG
jgi:hypothetical protein